MCSFRCFFLCLRLFFVQRICCSGLFPLAVWLNGCGCGVQTIWNATTGEICRFVRCFALLLYYYDATMAAATIHFVRFYWQIECKKFVVAVVFRVVSVCCLYLFLALLASTHLIRTVRIRLFFNIIIIIVCCTYLFSFFSYSYVLCIE